MVIHRLNHMNKRSKGGKWLIEREEERISKRQLLDFTPLFFFFFFFWGKLSCLIVSVEERLAQCAHGIKKYMQGFFE